MRSSWGTFLGSSVLESNHSALDAHFLRIALILSAIHLPFVAFLRL